MDARVLVTDLYAHQAWADAAHWRLIAPRPDVFAALRDRLHHIHIVQRSFLHITSGAPFAMTQASEFTEPAALLRYAREYHERAVPFVSSIDPAALDDALDVPWFRGMPGRITRGEALVQAAMHSQWHRGQNATRLKELGIEPPMIDLILWLLSGRPAPEWP